MQRINDTVLLLDDEGLIQRACDPVLAGYAVEVLKLLGPGDLITILRTVLVRAVKILVMDVTVSDHNHGLHREYSTAKFAELAMSRNPDIHILICGFPALWKQYQAPFQKACARYHKNDDGACTLCRFVCKREDVIRSEISELAEDLLIKRVHISRGFL